MGFVGFLLDLVVFVFFFALLDVGGCFGRLTKLGSIKLVNRLSL